MLTIALPKGRLLKDFIKYLDGRGAQEWVTTLEARDRQLMLTISQYDILLVKGSDVATYVEKGVADIGIIGSDILEETVPNVNYLIDLPFGHCHFAVAAKPETETFNRIATSYDATTKRFFEGLGQDVEIIHLNGSVELACKVDMVDAIVDIVQTGSTLRSNGLIEKQHIKDIQAKLITNKAAYFRKASDIDDFIQFLGVTIHDI
ncbi:ATP phosphoribosyltransferase [Staphylococcus massiliensis]|uniref:ATP phosphoribosyltransferase n=1 Tax=Staphylococcus massiliensis TaxID=555791 RepID=UPI001EDD03AC|nr:ATP phosphoribosyltransferase [Staphylococcus massiliensis]MCG3398706.1 ATP phosphoribosyltransferase [Staphylococcus massiliensis]